MTAVFRVGFIGLALIVTLDAVPCPVSFAQEEDGFGDDPEERARAVSEGDLEFLPVPPAEPVHHHTNRIRITAQSLADGWVGLEQCHRHLDPVPAAEVMFDASRLRDLEVTRYANIGRARVEGASVQLEDVGRGALLCLRAQSRALHRRGPGAYVLRNGPYMRRFLDGYFPMRVTMIVGFPAHLLRFTGSAPAPANGFRVEGGDGTVRVDTWFQGRLTTELYFSSLP